jgi:hypothetical protein
MKDSSFALVNRYLLADFNGMFVEGECASSSSSSGS